MTAEALQRPFNARLLYRFLYKRLLLPRGFVHGALSTAKRLTVRNQVERRKALAVQLSRAPAGGVDLDEAHACEQFQPGDIPGATAIAEYCTELYLKYRADRRDSEALQRNPSKRFLLSVKIGNEFEQYSDLLRFMVARPFLDAATRYLGTVPILEGAALWWTPPNDTAYSSQAWHIDELAQRQVKVIMNCLDVAEDNGPLHYLPADTSERVRRRARHRRGRLGDEWLKQADVTGHIERTLGPPGSGVILDSSRCLHFGSRGNHRDRLVLTFHYLPLDAPTETRYNIRLSRLHPGCEDLDEIQRLALGFA